MSGRLPDARAKHCAQLFSRSSCLTEAIKDCVSSDGRPTFQRKNRQTINKTLRFLRLIEDVKHLEYKTSGCAMDIAKIKFKDPSFHMQIMYMGVPGVGRGNVAAPYMQRHLNLLPHHVRIEQVAHAYFDIYFERIIT